MRSAVKIIILLCLFALPVFAAGKSPGVVGAYMNLRVSDAGTPDMVRAMVNEAADAGIQFLLPYSRTTEGTAFYDSKIMPHVNRDFDVLKVVIETAHARGMKVYPWFVVNCDGFSEMSPILKEHPDWCMVDEKGKKVPWLDPSSPEARQYVVSIVKELAANYDIDGINLDYLRYETPGRFCFCDRCKTQFKEAFGYDAVEAHNAKPYTKEWTKWRLWRQRQNDQMAREIHAALKEVKPEAELSSYVWGAQAYGIGWQICQDWKTWIKEGLLDWVNPMGYYSDRREFVNAAKWNRDAAPDFPMLVTVKIPRRDKKEIALDKLKLQIRDAMDADADGVVFFTLEYARPMLKDLSPLLHELAAQDQQKITVMTYNVLYGAGVDPAEVKIVRDTTKGEYADSRLDRVISVIKHVNPDIVGIQEACSWDKNNEAVAKQVAKELGMHYYVAKSGKSRFNVALFSKFPIVSAKGFPDHFSRAALQAELKLPDGRLLHAFVGHFNLLRNMESQLQEIRYLAQQMKPYSSDLSVMIGDANFKYGVHKESTAALRASEFLIAPPVGVRIDQIWTSMPLTKDVKEGPKIPAELTKGTSDHLPTVMVIGIPAKGI